MEIANTHPVGKIILLNGASSSGKSTLGAALQDKLPEAFWHFSIDHLIAGRVLPQERIDSGEFQWHDLRGSFFEGFHRALPALAQGGNNLIVEHIVESREWLDRLLRLLNELDVFFVGLHCPLEELERREALRGNRRLGDARRDFESIHSFCAYDFELDSTLPVAENAEALIDAWQRRTKPSAWDRMRAGSIR